MSLFETFHELPRHDTLGFGSLAMPRLFTEDGLQDHREQGFYIIDDAVGAQLHQSEQLAADIERDDDLALDFLLRDAPRYLRPDNGPTLKTSQSQPPQEQGEK